CLREDEQVRLSKRCAIIVPQGNSPGKWHETWLSSLAHVCLRHDREQPPFLRLNHMTTNRRLKRGFTLTELLVVMVVIAVIAVLAALLIPSVLHSKFKSRVVNCASNYKQLTLASALYATDDPKGRLPSFELPTDSSQLMGFGNLANIKWQLR